MTEWDYIFEIEWNKYSINAILERKRKLQNTKKLRRRMKND